MAEWSNEMMLEFLELYAAEAVLYNPNSKNKKLMNNAWLRIQQRFTRAMPVSELKKKKDSLMACFRYYMRRKKEAFAMGEFWFKPTWFAFSFMYGFLGQIYENEKTYLNTEDSGPVLEFVDLDAIADDSPSNDSSPGPSELINSQDNNDSSPCPSELIKSQDIKHELIELVDKPELNAKEKRTKATSKRKKLEDTEQVEELDQSSTFSQNDDEDECDLYGKLIAKKLKKLPESQRERLMYEIQGLFVKCSQYRQTP